MVQRPISVTPDGRAPATVDEAVKALASAAGSTKVLSGGTDLLVQLKSGRIKPDLIVDTKRIPDLIGIREEGGFYVIGAATPGVMRLVSTIRSGFTRPLFNCTSR